MSYTSRTPPDRLPEGLGPPSPRHTRGEYDPEARVPAED